MPACLLTAGAAVRRDVTGGAVLSAGAAQGIYEYP